MVRTISDVEMGLKSGGVFSLHLAGASAGGPASDLGGPIPVGMDGAMCRTPEYARDLIHDVTDDCQITEAGERMMWPQFKTYWYFFRITKERANADV